MNYEIVTLDEISEKIDYGLTTSATSSDTGIKFLRITDIQENGVDWQSVPFCECSEKDLKQYSLARGDIVFARTGATTGKSFLIKDTPEKTVFASYLIRVRSNQKLVDPDFLSCFFQTPQYWQQISNSAVGAAQVGVNGSKLAELKLPLPPLTEQKRIASLLARADRLRQLRRTAHDLGDALLQSVFLEMFGDPFRNEKGWERIEIAELIRSGDTINYGVVQPGDDFPNGTPVIRVGDLDNLDKDITSLKLIDPKIEASYKRSRIVGDEILIACVGSIGKIALATEKMKGFNIVRAVARVPADYSLVNRLFLAAYLSMPIIQDFFQRETRTVAQPTLNITQIEETPILMPPLSLQEEFAGVVARVESLRGRMGESSRQVEGLFESLLAQSFDGGR